MYLGGSIHDVKTLRLGTFADGMNSSHRVLK
jgi:hypothetical protein